MARNALTRRGLRDWTCMEEERERQEGGVSSDESKKSIMGMASSVMVRQSFLVKLV